MLILTSAEVDAVLDTIRSRCRQVSFRPLTVAEATAALERAWGVDAEHAELLARLSAGRLGWAVRAAQDDSVLAAREKWLSALAEVLGSDTATRLKTAESLCQSADAATGGLAVWLGWWRDLMLYRCGLEDLIANRDRLHELREAAARIPLSRAVESLRAVEDAMRRLAVSTNPLLTMEVLMLELPR
jgi:DNA polymerase-3 subunit delta'